MAVVVNSSGTELARARPHCDYSMETQNRTTSRLPRHSSVAMVFNQAR
ncbi:hypothetical protein F441_19933 [Phytophthora nicotianae CJ01A1]|uniref:Uncharacterized protein n=3 Tax=Phytophthora nicotianae TaxID=4792 RepID=W2PHY7_PHYN3|nr:hypothetical protein PPTG_24245 [Phytophthora nicotianae INRA-310]ETK73570.1 hypothetical protein L915_19515 [Phytophthora nicotianae]ETP03087.1 hypothetical protein F441_19933 [Phytophthora nicotianae CJ01A1]ETL27007.1 hypothetical protein L916_19404 [Phytophthora nicotianae]ETL80245.1 hypothetical protein L917_19248 [Phytophthora nicotianae]ETM33495.1 hypothetical protein L914_19282 [Phytophthora nicotianae]